MNRTLLAGVAALALVTGCAPSQFTKAELDGRIVCNADVMDQVERSALRRSAKVEWINCPTAALRVI